MSGTVKRPHEEASAVSGSLEQKAPAAAVPQYDWGRDEHNAGFVESRPPKIARHEPQEAVRTIQKPVEGSSAPVLEAPAAEDVKVEVKEGENTTPGTLELGEIKLEREAKPEPTEIHKTERWDRDYRVGSHHNHRRHGDYRDPSQDKDHGYQYPHRPYDYPPRFPPTSKDHRYHHHRGHDSRVGGRFREPRESSGENRLEWRREERDKDGEKERERERERDRDKKDDKQRERDDRQVENEDIKGNLQINLSTDAEKEKKDKGREKEKEVGKEKGREADRGKERERDSSHRDWTVKEERDAWWQEKEEKDGGTNLATDNNGGTENMEIEKMMLRDSEKKRGSGNDDRERIREMDREGDGEKGKDRMRDYEKEREEGSIEGEGQSERETLLNHGVIRKRILRPRMASSFASREARSRFRPKDRDLWHGKPESSILGYKVGEGLPELTRLWKEYKSSLTNNSENTNPSPTPTIEIRVPADLATTANRQVRGSQLWGTDIYTDDSDLVAVLMHTGYYSPTSTPPPSSILELRATIRVLPPQDSYKSTLQNNVRSRAWGAGTECSYSIESCRIVKSGGGIFELEPCLSRIPSIAPTLAPAAMERTITTRAASSNAYRQQRFVQEVTIQYNLCNEPWLKYSMSIVADRGLKKSQYTSARLKKGEVLYVETHTQRFELSSDNEKTPCNGTAAANTATSFPQIAAAFEKGKDKSVGSHASHGHNGHGINGDKNHGNGGQHATVEVERYKWARCKTPLPLTALRTKGIPLPADYIEVLEDGLGWEEVEWSPTGVWVRGKEYQLARAQFLSPHMDCLEN